MKDKAMNSKSVNSKPLIGFATGDALSWNSSYSNKLENVVELPSWSREEGYGSNIREESIESGEFSDYTLQVLCVARSLLYRNWFENLAYNELPTWLSYSRETTGRGKYAIANLNKSLPWEEDNQQSRNFYTTTDTESVARALPHVLYNGKDLFTSLKSSFESAILSSGSPVVPLSACLYASALYYFTNPTESFSDTLSEILESFLSKFSEIQTFSSRYITSYIQKGREYINFDEQWNTIISEINFLMLDFNNTKDIKTYFLSGINNSNIIIREVLYSICLSCTVNTFEEAIDTISKSRFINKHFVTSLVFSLLSAKLPEEKYPLYFYTVQSRGYMTNLCKHYHQEELEAPIIKSFTSFDLIPKEITSLERGETYNLSSIGEITVLDTGDISKYPGVVCKASICSLGGVTDNINGLFFNFYSFV